MAPKVASPARSMTALAAAVAVAAAALYSATGLARYDGKWLFNSPDEASAAVAVQAVADSGSLVAPTPGPWPPQLQRARSVQPVANGWAPGSFIGLPFLYGPVAGVAGLGGVLVLGALLAGLGVWLAYRLTSRVIGQPAGVAAAAAMAASPAYWSTAAHPLWQASLMIVLAMLGLELLLSARRRPYLLLAGGLAFGLAAAVRTVEALWLLPVLALASWQVVRGPRLLWVTLGLAAALAPLARVYDVIYVGSSASAAYDVGAALATGSVLQPSLAAVARNIWLYLVRLQWWLLIPAAAGKLALLRMRIAGSWPLALALAATVAAQLVTYGGLTTFDSPGLAEPALGNSHVRYWLPVNVVVAWLAGFGLYRIWIAPAWRAVAVAATLGVLALSTHLVMLSPGDGVLDVRRTLAAYAEERRSVLEAVPPGTLLIAGKADKLLLGDRPVTYDVHDAHWPEVAAGLRRGWAAATYSQAPASLPPEAAAAGVAAGEAVQTSAGRYVTPLIAR